MATRTAEQDSPARCGSDYLRPDPDGRARPPDADTAGESRDTSRQQHWDNLLPHDSHLLFTEVTLTDTPELEVKLDVEGVQRHGCRVLCVRSTAIPNTVAAVRPQIR